MTRILLTSIALCALLIGANNRLVAQAETDDFTGHVEHVAQALSSLTDEVQKLQNDYNSAVKSCEDLQKQYDAATSWLEQGKLKVELALAKRVNGERQARLHKRKVQLHIYYCVLFRSKKHRLTAEQKQQGASYAADMEKMRLSAKERAKTAQERATAAEKRIVAIPEEITQTESAITSLNKRIQVLEDKKTWGNLPERMELKTRLGLQQSRILKLKGEMVVQEKILADSVQEQKSLKLELRELQIALEVIK